MLRWQMRLSKMPLLRLLSLLALCGSSMSFAPRRLTGGILAPRPKVSSPSSRTSRMVLAPQTVEEAIPRFWVWLVMGNGALTVGLGQMPRLLGRHLTVQRLGGAERRGGPELDVPSWLVLYPEAPSIADLEAVVNSELLNDITAIVENGPQDTYLAQQGMLTYAAWTAAFLGPQEGAEKYAEKGAGEGEEGGSPQPRYNPLAVRALFDPFNACSDAVNPPVAFEYVMKWREEGFAGPGASFSADLLKSKALSYSAGISFVGIILFVADIIYEEARMADIMNHLPQLPF